MSPSQVPAPTPARRRTRPQLVTASQTLAVPAPVLNATDGGPIVGAVDPVIVEPSAFGSAPWWSRDWWRIPDGGSARDVDCDAGTVDTLAVIGASLRGHKHRLDAAANDDAFVLRTGIDDAGARWLIGCVCDGLGSASRSDEGSRFVAGRFAAALAELIGSKEWNAGDPGTALLDRIVMDVTTEAGQGLVLGEDALEDFETTLTFVAVEASPPDGIARRSLFGWVGDSPVFILRSGEWYPVDPTGPEDAATGLVSSRTNGFFTSKRLDQSMSVALASDEVVLISSDGIGSFVSDGSRTLRIGTMFADVLAHPTEVMRVLNLLSFDMRSADDDRTAIIVWQLANGAATPPTERLDREPAGNDHEGATAGEGRE